MIDNTVSIILPMHNAEAYARRAFSQLDSLTETPFEVVLVNDGSTDATQRLIDEWCMHTQIPTKQILNPRPIGVAAARNAAVRASEGHLVWFVDCDDEWESDIVEHLVYAITASDADISICNANRVIEGTNTAHLINDAPSDEQISGRVALNRLLLGEIQGHLWNKLFKRHLFNAIEFPTTRAHSDLGAMLSLFAASASVALATGVKYDYCVHPGSILNSKDYRWQDLIDCEEIARNEVSRLGQDKPLEAAFLVFRYSHILVPLTNEQVRRKPVSDVGKTFRSKSKSLDLLRLAVSGNIKLAARCSLIIYFPGLYAYLYSKVRARVWGTVSDSPR